MIDIDIPARDGFKLAATVFEPASSPRAIVQLNSATGVVRQFYRHFAAMLVEHGYVVVTFDYRGIGESLRSPIETFPGHIRDWGEQDAAGVTDWCRARWPELRLIVFGHSVGGQLIGLCDNNGEYERAIAFAAGSGYWRLWPEDGQARRQQLWENIVPAAVSQHGYFPGKQLGMLSDLPGGIARSWAHWCCSPDYVVDDQGRPLRTHFHSFKAPMHFLSIADDDIAHRTVVDALMSFYAHAPKTIEVLTPEKIGLESIGHFGFFRREASSAWQQALAWFG